MDIRDALKRALPAPATEQCEWPGGKLDATRCCHGDDHIALDRPFRATLMWADDAQHRWLLLQIEQTDTAVRATSRTRLEFVTPSTDLPSFGEVALPRRPRQDAPQLPADTMLAVLATVRHAMHAHGRELWAPTGERVDAPLTVSRTVARAALVRVTHESPDLVRVRAPFVPLRTAVGVGFGILAMAGAVAVLSPILGVFAAAFGLVVGWSEGASRGEIEAEIAHRELRVGDVRVARGELEAVEPARFGPGIVLYGTTGARRVATAPRSLAAVLADAWNLEPLPPLTRVDPRPAWAELNVDVPGARWWRGCVVVDQLLASPDGLQIGAHLVAAPRLDFEQRPSNAWTLVERESGHVLALDYSWRRLQAVAWAIHGIVTADTEVPAAPGQSQD